MLLLKMELIPPEKLRERETNNLVLAGEPSIADQVLQLLCNAIGNFKGEGLQAIDLRPYLSTRCRTARRAPRDLS